MKASVYSHKQLIGTTDLQVGDKRMHTVCGEFIPTDSYFKDIQKYVWAFGATNSSDYNNWHSLRFNVQLDNGYFLCPVGGYAFYDSSDFPNEPKRIGITGLDRHVMEGFFLKETPGSFAEAPWHQLTIEQKIGLEDELSKETGLTKSSTFDGSQPMQEPHALAGYTFSALCRYQCNDDVLFTDVTR